MVVLSRIYTKTGDKGTTALGSGTRVRKDHARIEAYGTVDELNSLLGLVLAACTADPDRGSPNSGGVDAEAAGLMRRIQNDLFDLGADLCVPEAASRGRSRRTAARAPLRITTAHVDPLERAIDRFNSGLGTLRSFVLPGGTAASAWLHIARTVCRRAERRVVTLAGKEKVNPQAIIYLNRLSDLLFVIARRANDGGRGDILWTPGGDEAQRR